MGVISDEELKKAMRAAFDLGGIKEMDELWEAQGRQGGHGLRRAVIGTVYDDIVEKRLWVSSEIMQEVVDAIQKEFGFAVGIAGPHE